MLNYVWGFVFRNNVITSNYVVHIWVLIGN